MWVRFPLPAPLANMFYYFTLIWTAITLVLEFFVARKNPEKPLMILSKKQSSKSTWEFIAGGIVGSLMGEFAFRYYENVIFYSFAFLSLALVSAAITLALMYISRKNFYSFTAGVVIGLFGRIHFNFFGVRTWSS